MRDEGGTSQGTASRRKRCFESSPLFALKTPGQRGTASRVSRRAPRSLHHFPRHRASCWGRDRRAGRRSAPCPTAPPAGQSECRRPFPPFPSFRCSVLLSNYLSSHKARLCFRSDPIIFAILSSLEPGLLWGGVCTTARPSGPRTKSQRFQWEVVGYWGFIVYLCTLYTTILPNSDMADRYGKRPAPTQ